MINIFINDIKHIGSKGIGVIAKVKLKLTTTSEMVDIRLISFYLRLRVDKNYKIKTIKLPQPA